MTRRFPLVCMLALSALAGPVFADDWPQWMGPRRDGVWREQGIVEKFPEGGAKVKWKVPIGAGYAGPAVAGGKVFVMDRVVKPDAPKPKNAFDREVTVPGVERIVCVNEADGKVLWTAEYDCPYAISYNSGPRCTPIVDGDRVYALGAEGHLLCLDAATGKVLWQNHLSGDGSPIPDSKTTIWGYSGHPLIDGDKLICLTGGRNGVVSAFDKKTGKVLWTSLSAKDPGYAPPMIYEAGGVRQLIVWHTESVNGLDPETGKVYWTEPFGPITNGVSITTPILHRDPKLGDLLMISAAREGTLMLKLDKDAPKTSVLWKRGDTGKQRGGNEHGLCILMAAPVIRDGHIYGVNIDGKLRCIRLSDGETVWDTFQATTGEGPAVWSNAFIVPLGESGNRHILANEHGHLILANLSPKGYEEISRAKVLEATNMDARRPVLWCHPAYANKCVYWRNDKEVICVSLEATK